MNHKLSLVTLVFVVFSLFISSGLTAQQGPSAPANPSPSDGETDVSVNPLLQWDAVTNADTYSVWFAESGETLSNVASGLENPEYDVNPLDFGQTYQWRVDVTDDQGNTTQGNVWTFQTEGIISPSGGEQWIVGTSRAIRWSPNVFSGDLTITLHRTTNQGSEQVATVVNNYASGEGLVSFTVPPVQNDGDGANVFLTFDHGGGSIDSRSFQVRERQQVAFELSPPVPLVNNNVTIHEQAQVNGDSVTSRTWNFYRGHQTETGESPTLSFESAGPRPVELTVDTAGGSTHTSTRTVFARGSGIPAAPAFFHAIPSDGTIKLFWPEAQQDGDVNYVVRVRDGNSFDETVSFSSAPDLYHEIGNSLSLSNETEYFLELYAVDPVSDETSHRIPARVTPFNVRVGNNYFQDIQSAIDAASTGDTVWLAGETYEPGTTLSLPSGISLRGQMPGITTIDSSGSLDAIFLEEGSERSRISHMTLTGSTDNGIFAELGAELHLHNTIVRGFTTGISLIGIDDGLIRNNNFIQNLDEGIYIEGNDLGLDLRNNVYYENENAGIVNQGVLTAGLNYFNTFGNGNADPQQAIWVEEQHFSPNASAFTFGFHFLNKNPRFRDPGNNDYRLQSDSPLIAQGHPGDKHVHEPGFNGSRINIGAFGNTVFAAESSITESVHSSSTREQSATVNVFNSNEEISFSATPDGGDMELNWDIPFHEDGFNGVVDDDSLTAVIRYRPVDQSTWSSVEINIGPPEFSGGGSFQLSGGGTFTDLDPNTRYEFSLEVIFNPPLSSARTADPILVEGSTGSGSGSGGGGGGGPTGPLFLAFLLLAGVIQWLRGNTRTANPRN